MNYEQLIAAKVRYTQVDSIMAICFGISALLLAVVLWVIARHIDKKNSRSDAPDIMLVVACVAAFFGLIFIPVGTYGLLTAEVKARADLANYNLIELKK